MTRARTRWAARIGALLLATAAVVGLTALPAAAHASLISVEPQPGSTYDAPPPAVVLRFTEPVETTLGSVRVFDGDGERVDVGAPEHPDGRGDEVRADLPDLDDGTYVVTWRVTSADAHPVEGAFTFQVGATPTARDADSLAARLLRQQAGSTSVGVAFTIARAVLYGAISLLVGGLLFLAWVFPDARGASGTTRRRASRVLWTGWGSLLVATLAGIGLEGAYVAALPLSKAVDPSVFGDVLDTRYGRFALLRLAVVLLAFPLVRMVLRRRELPAWWAGAATLVAVVLAASPVFAGHAATGDHSTLALATQTIHVLAMSCWLGGLVLLIALVLVRPLPDGLRGAVNRFSALALACVGVLLVTGAFQTWRQVDSLAALKDTDFGRLLLAKLVVFAVMVVAAAFSREVVNRHFRDGLDDDRAVDADHADARAAGAGEVASVAADAARVPVLVGAATGDRGAPPAAEPRPVGGGHDDEPTDDEEAGVLRRSVWVELAFAAVILVITALLVNTAPARTESTEPVAISMQRESVFADGTIAPGAAGRNDLHLTVLSTAGAPIEEVQVQLTRPDGKLPPLDVPLRTLGPGHYFAPQYEIPFPGDWTLVARVRRGATDEVVLTQTFNLR